MLSVAAITWLFSAGRSSEVILASGLISEAGFSDGGTTSGSGS
jgi:hypothetical protein